jgi:ribosomal protein L11 methyltransferase
VICTRLTIVPSPTGTREAVSAALFVAGAQGILEEGERLISVFADAAIADDAEREVRTVDPDARIDRERFEPGDYDAEWRAGVEPRWVGRMRIAPSWRAAEGDLASTIVIEPGTGFGTGEHETTRCALLLLQDVVQPGQRVADLGCGSAVLAIAAARLGASRVVAIELDGEAIPNAEENVLLNDAGDRVTVIEGDAGALLPLVGPVDIVVANIISSVLVQLLPAVRPALAPDASVVVSGVLVEERTAFVEWLTAEGWGIERETAEGEWWAAVLRVLPRP